MPKPISLPAATLLAALLTAPALAQGGGQAGTGSAATDQPPAASADQGPPPSGSAPAAPSHPQPAASAPAGQAPSPAAGQLPGVTATTDNPNLAVATIKLESGKRLSKIIGAAVYGQDSKELGKVDDLVMSNGDRVTLAVISAGGFLGLGSKLIAFPFSQLKTEGDRLTLPGVTPQTLNAMPSFRY